MVKNTFQKLSKIAYVLMETLNIGNIVLNRNLEVIYILLS